MEATSSSTVHKADNGQLISILRDLVVVNEATRDTSRRLMQESRDYSRVTKRR